MATADFPPLPTTSVSSLCEMFPTIERAVVQLIMTEADGDDAKAIEQLLAMSEDSVVSHNETEDVPNVSLSTVSASLLSPKPTFSSSFPTSLRDGSPLSLSQSSMPRDLLNDIQNNVPLLVILRGLPGSGKSTLAKKLLKSCGQGIILSTDDFFSKNGIYHFKADRLSEAHSWNQKRALTAVENKVKLLIIDNTNTMSWEMRPYIEMGVVNKYNIHILEPDTPWKFKPRILAEKNSHGVPKQKIEIMLDRYEKKVDLDQLKRSWNLPDSQDQNSQSDEEIFESDDENVEEQFDCKNESEEESVLLNECSNSALNPDVQEFIPNFNREDHVPVVENVLNDPDISMLVSMFPHLSIDEAASLYHKHGQDTKEVIAELLETADASREANVSNPNEESEYMVKMSLDPVFATCLQSMYGAPLPSNDLGKLNSSQFLSVEIPSSLANQIFYYWQQSLQNALLYNVPDENPSEEAPRTVLAPNAVQHYEKQWFDQAVKNSMNVEQPKSKPMIVVKPLKKQEATTNENKDELEKSIEQRNMLYRKAMATKGSHMQGAASYYAAQARELNARIKTSQKQNQMEMFLNVNKDTPNTKLDLHYLQTADAIKQLQQFLSQKEAAARNVGAGGLAVEIITGKGNRSENGKSRLRPAVQNWLEQKNYSYTEVNSGCFKVKLRGE